MLILTLLVVGGLLIVLAYTQRAKHSQNQTFWTIATGIALIGIAATGDPWRFLETAEQKKYDKCDMKKVGLFWECRGNPPMFNKDGDPNYWANFTYQAGGYMYGTYQKSRVERLIPRLDPDIAECFDESNLRKVGGYEICTAFPKAPMVAATQDAIDRMVPMSECRQAELLSQSGNVARYCYFVEGRMKGFAKVEPGPHVWTLGPGSEWYRKYGAEAGSCSSFEVFPEKDATIEYQTEGGVWVPYEYYAKVPEDKKALFARAFRITINSVLPVGVIEVRHRFIEGKVSGHDPEKYTPHHTVLCLHE